MLGMLQIQHFGRQEAFQRRDAKRFSMQSESSRMALQHGERSLESEAHPKRKSFSAHAVSAFEASVMLKH